MIELTARCMNPLACAFAQGTFCENNACAVSTDEVKFPCSVSDHEKRLRKLECCVSGLRPVTLHHCRGGSMSETPFGSPGAGQKQNDALQIPLAWTWHTGQYGIDARVNSSASQWESRWGTQVELLNSTSHQLQYSQWTLAWYWASPLVRARVERFLMQSLSRCHLP